MIQLNHVGEHLISAIINRSADIKLVMQSVFGISPEHLLAVPEIRLDRCEHLIFDGAHKIDISLLDMRNNTCIPIEAKLGLDRLSKSEFEKRFLKGCHTSHNETRIAGSMISVLERLLPPECNDKQLSVIYEGQRFTLSNQWGLISREKIFNRWNQGSFPKLSANCRHLKFEELVRKFGSKDNFNSLITELLDVDFYSQWIIPE